MPQNIVRMEDIPNVVADTLKGIRDGLLAARKEGILAEWPKTVDFQMTVVKDFEILHSQSIQTTKGSGKEGGYQTESSLSAQIEARGSSTINEENGTHTHVQNSESVQSNFSI